MFGRAIVKSIGLLKYIYRELAELSLYQKTILILLTISIIVSLKGAHDAQEANYYSNYAYDYAASASDSASRAAEYAERTYKILD